MLIEVTTKNIKEGKKESIPDCPVALALKEAFPKNKRHVQVGYNNLDIGLIKFGPVNDVEKHYVTAQEPMILMSNRVKKFVRDFDNGKKVKSFKFFIPNSKVLYFK